MLQLWQHLVADWQVPAGSLQVAWWGNHEMTASTLVPIRTMKKTNAMFMQFETLYKAILLHLITTESYQQEGG